MFGRRDDRLQIDNCIQRELRNKRRPRNQRQAARQYKQAVAACTQSTKRTIGGRYR